MISERRFSIYATKEFEDGERDLALFIQKIINEDEFIKDCEAALRAAHDAYHKRPPPPPPKKRWWSSW